MPKWEYKHVVLIPWESWHNPPEYLCVKKEKRLEWLNEQGAEGWEVIICDWGPEKLSILLKRPLTVLANSEWITND